MKRLLYIFIVLMMVLCAEAQTLVPGPLHQPIRKAQGNFTFTYFTGDDISCIGLQSYETYDAAIFVPENFAGMKIRDIAFCLYDKNVIKDVKAWVRPSLAASDEDTFLFCADVPAAQLVNCDDGDGMTRVTVSDELVIPAGGCYVGYCLTVTSNSSNAGQFPIITTYQQPDQEGGFYLRATPSMPSWVDNYGKGYGNLTIEVGIVGEFPANALEISGSFPMTNVLIGKQCDMAVTLTGRGANPVSRFTYVVSEEGSDQADTISVKINGLISLNEVASVNLFAPADRKVGLRRLRLEIIKVNGEDNEAADRVAYGTMLTLGKELPKRVCFEEITGNQCGWCPRGITGMERIREVYPDQISAIAYHLYNSTDPMYQEFMLPMSPYYQEAPSCMLDRRSFNLDPFYGSYGGDFGILQDINDALAIPAEATVNVEPMWDETGQKIFLNTKVAFSYDNPDAPYRLAYVVVEDGLNSKSEAWIQQNYYRYFLDTYGEEATKEMLGIDEDSPLWRWTQSGTYIKNMKYDNVCIAGRDIDLGIEGSIADPIVADAVQRHEACIDLTDNPVLKRPENVRVVALLINSLNGAIVNTDSQLVAAYAEGIADVVTAPSALTIYTLDGRRQSHPTTGINVINGKKIIR